MSNYAREHLEKPDVIWKQVLWTDKFKIDRIQRMAKTSNDKNTMTF